MRVIIAGGRNFTDRHAVTDAIIASGFIITECVCGGASGADNLGALICHARGIPVRLFPADWQIYGKRAGPVRNRQMAEYAEALIALPGDDGTANMLDEARKRGLKVYEA